MSHASDEAAAHAVREAVSLRVYRVFCSYIEMMLSRRFDGLRMLGDLPAGITADRSMLVYANHPSWYDPLVFFHIQSRHFPSHHAYGPMDAAALEKYGFMKKLGIFGVEQDSRRGAVDFLRISRGLIARPPVSIWMTPQGEFADVRRRPVAFKPGLAHLARDCDVIMIPLAMELVFWDEARPELLVHFGEPADTRVVAPADGDWNAELERRMEAAQDALAQAAMSRDPDRFTTLIAGRSGVNPFYDAWRYLKAMVRGERFSAAHRDVKK